MGGGVYCEAQGWLFFGQMIFGMDFPLQDSFWTHQILAFKSEVCLLLNTLYLTFGNKNKVNRLERGTPILKAAPFLELS